ncbi:MAG: aminoacyl-tRNA hydrolase [Phycisphaerales bacterium]|nr:aminoacyl-tRNA hydrolase [Phycisphaerales bacterium]NNM25919.1 aminoacyl-tRNA hydrolase [Phycisphaerales bacterium]
MKLIVGLGNPGAEYADTRHNVGFDVLDRLARRWAPGEVARSKFHGAVIDGRIDSERVMLLKPLTFMNRSGTAVAEATRFYKVDPAEDVLVIVDDVALPCGTIRIRAGGSAGGHNGLADIEMRLGTSQYTRLRIGIDPPGRVPQKDYVLGRFRPEQRDMIEPALEDAVHASETWAKSGTTEAMNRFNRKPDPVTERDDT